MVSGVDQGVRGSRELAIELANWSATRFEALPGFIVVALKMRLRDADAGTAGWIRLLHHLHQLTTIVTACSRRRRELASERARRNGGMPTSPGLSSQTGLENKRKMDT